MNTFKLMSVILSLVLGMADAYAVVVAPGRIVDQLGAALAVQDVYRFKCPYGTVSASVEVRDANENPLNINNFMFATLSKGGATAGTVDNNPIRGPGLIFRPLLNGEDGVQGAPSAPAVLAGGPGVYDLIFSGSNANPALVAVDNYRGDVLCNLVRGSIKPLPVQTQNK